MEINLASLGQQVQSIMNQESILLLNVTLTLQYIHVFSVTLTPTPGGSHPVYTPLNDIIKIIKCDLN